MEKLSTVAYGVIALVVVVILIFTIALPVIEDAQKEQRSTDNNSSMLYSSVETSESVSLVKTGTGASAVTLNGVDISTMFPTLTQNSQRIYLFWDTGIIMLAPSTGGTFNLGAYYLNEGTLTGYSNLVSMEAADGAITFTNTSEQTLELAYTWMMIPSTTGDYASYRPSDWASHDVFIDSDSIIYCAAQSNDIDVVAKGTLDSMAVMFIADSSQTYSAGSIAINTTPTEYEASNEFTSVDIVKGTTSMSPPTYFEIFVPVKYTTVTDNDSMIITLLGVIPLILAIVPVMLAVQLMTGGRRD